MPGEGADSRKKRNPKKKPRDVPLPNTPAGNAQYDAELGGDSTVKRPAIPGGLLDQWGVRKVEIDPDDID